MTSPLRVRWLGRVAYREAHAVMTALWANDPGDALLLLEHPPTYTLGVRADPAHVLVPPASVGADLVRTDRGGDVTFHGPGQLVGYPILNVALGPNAIPNHVHAIEQLLIDALADLGLPGASRFDGYPGVWIGVAEGKPRKIAAIGVRVSKGRSMHGFALNVSTDLAWFDHIVPCGIAEYPVTSLAAEGVTASMRDVVDAVAARAGRTWGDTDRADVAWAHRPDDLAAFSRAHAEGRALGRLAAAGVDSSTAVTISARKPEWLRAKANFGPDYRSLKKTMRSLELVTVCEEAGCPNISECWSDGTATFMINGERCTRACGFCLVDTRKPQPPSPDEPERVADAVAQLRLKHAVVTTVARDDLDDGGAGAFAATIAAIRRRSPGTAVEVLISDCKGDPASLDVIFAARPEVLNHNLETVARLQRAVRPSAGYARSLGVLAQAKAAGLVTKSGVMVGLGESHAEVLGALRDLRGVGVDIVTVGQYLRPTEHHLPVARWWTPDEFAALKADADALGFAHVECSPLTRSSYHARSAAESAATPLAVSASFS